MKKIGILGTGMVGTTIGTRLTELGYQVKMGSRVVNNDKAIKWAEKNGPKASHGTFEDAAKFGNMIFNCTKGEIAVEVITSAGIENFNNKIVVDISNPLDFSHGMPPFLIPEFVNTNSLGEEIQRLLPQAHVVKTLNIVNCEVMVNAAKCGGEATMFLSGNSTSAKAEVKIILERFGWNDLIDLGDITTARGTEMMLPIWLRTYMATGNGYMAFKIVR